MSEDRSRPRKSNGRYMRSRSEPPRKDRNVQLDHDYIAISIDDKESQPSVNLTIPELRKTCFNGCKWKRLFGAGSCRNLESGAKSDRVGLSASTAGVPYVS